MKNLILTLFGIYSVCISVSTFAYTSYAKQDIREMVIAEALRQEIDPALALAIAKVESDFRAEVVSHAGAIGVMQIMPATAESEFGISRHRLFEPQTNIRIGVGFIKHLIKAYKGRVDIALSHYNGGSKVKDRHGNLSVIPATAAYVDKVSMYQQRFSSSEDIGLSARPSVSLVSRTEKLQHLKQRHLSYAEQIQRDKTPATPVKINTPQKQTSSVTQEVDGNRIAHLQALHLHNLSRRLPHNDSQKTMAIAQTTSSMGSATEQPGSTNKTSKHDKVREWESIFDKAR